MSRAERDLYVASRTAGDIEAAERGPEALAGRVARRQLRRAAFRGGMPLYLSRRRTGAPASSGAAPSMSPLGALAVMFGLLVLVGGTIACAVTGAWAGMVFVVIFGFGPMLWAGRGGRDGLPRK